MSQITENGMSKEYAELIKQPKPWDQLSVQRWQLDRLAAGLGEIQTTLDEAKLGDRMSVASATGFASGMAGALQMLVQSMKEEL